MLEFAYSSIAFSLGIILLLQLAIIRSEIKSIFDPLFYFVVSTSFALTFSILFVSDSGLVARVFLYFASFWIGFKLSIRRKIDRPAIVRPLTQDSTFSVICVLGVLGYISLNGYTWLTAPPPLLSDDPTLQKSQAFAGGLGFVRRFNWGMGTFLTLGSLYWLISTRSKVALACLSATIVMAVLSGSKGALIGLVFGLGLYVEKPFLDNRGSNLSAKIKRLSFPILVLASIPIALVLLKEQEDVGAASSALLTRLLYFGDSLIYWGDPALRQHFQDLVAPWDYPSHLLNPVLGMFRVTPYETPIGNQFVQFTLRLGEELPESLGPNTPFYVKGELFFGSYFAVVYSAAVGAVLAGFRRRFIANQTTSPMTYTLRACLAALAMTIPTEDSLFLGRLADFLMVFAFFSLLSRIIAIGTRTPSASFEKGPHGR